MNRHQTHLLWWVSGWPMLISLGYFTFNIHPPTTIVFLLLNYGICCLSENNDGKVLSSLKQILENEIRFGFTPKWLKLWLFILDVKTQFPFFFYFSYTHSNLFIACTKKKRKRKRVNSWLLTYKFAWIVMLYTQKERIHLKSTFQNDYEYISFF